jgi:hypothetical protein
MKVELFVYIVLLLSEYQHETATDVATSTVRLLLFKIIKL